MADRIKLTTRVDGIEWLTSSWLRKVADSRDYGAWETLFRDTRDGRLWERTYPQGNCMAGDHRGWL